MIPLIWLSISIFVSESRTKNYENQTLLVRMPRFSTYRTTYGISAANFFSFLLKCINQVCRFIFLQNSAIFSSSQCVVRSVAKFIIFFEYSYCQQSAGKELLYSRCQSPTLFPYLQGKCFLRLLCAENRRNYFAKPSCTHSQEQKSEYKRARNAVSLCDQDTTTNEYKFCFLRTQQIAVVYSRCLGLQNDLCLNFCTKQMRHEKGFLRLCQRSEIRILSFFMYQGSGVRTFAYHA